MSSVIFNKKTLMWSGTNRVSLPFELQINNVLYLDKLEKKLILDGVREKVDNEGRPVYLLPKDPETKTHTVVEYIETTKVTDKPVIIKTTKQIPVLDESGKPLTYHKMYNIKVTDNTGNPVLIDEKQERDNDGNLLFWKSIPYGPELPMYTVKEIKVQKQNDNGELLYLTPILKTITETEEFPYIEITSDDPRFNNSLTRAIEKYKYEEKILFSVHPELFSYSDVIFHKEKYIAKGTFYEKGKLYETMDGIFETSSELSNANFAFDFITLHPGGFVTTLPLDIQEASQIVLLVTESSGNLSCLMGSDKDSLQPLTPLNEGIFSKPVDKVVIKFMNNTKQAIDLYSFGLIV